MNLKARVLKLENSKQNKTDNMIVIFIDDICTYEVIEYTAKEFYKLYPNFDDDNAICINVI